MPYPYPAEIKNSRVMVFIDGENLAIRDANLLGENKPFDHVQFEKDIYVWSPLLDLSSHLTVNTVR
ncbi:MAG: hypothetical protein KA318_04975, partial [Nitrosomonas sp.]|nr:hypothetical protein [Nitrosomonas sp.]